MLQLLRTNRCAVGTAALSLGLVVLAGCGPGDGLTRGPIKGRVTVGGQPLAKGRVLFLPVAPNTGPTVSAPIVGGDYQLPRREGPVVGKNRVEVEAELDLGFAIDDEAAFAQRGGWPLPPNSVPPEFNRNSQLVIEIKPGEENALDIAVPSTASAAATASR